MSHEGGSESAQQRTVAELLAKYGAEADERAPRRRRRRQDDPTDTAPQAIIERVNSESAKLAPIRDDTPPPRRTSHRRSATHQQPPADPRAQRPAEPRPAESRRDLRPAEPRRAEPRRAEPPPRAPDPVPFEQRPVDSVPFEQRPAEHRPPVAPPRAAAPPPRPAPPPPAAKPGPAPLPPVPHLPAIAQSEPTRPVADPSRPLAEPSRTALPAPSRADLPHGAPTEQSHPGLSPEQSRADLPRGLSPEQSRADLPRGLSPEQSRADLPRGAPPEKPRGVPPGAGGAAAQIQRGRRSGPPQPAPPGTFPRSPAPEVAPQHPGTPPGSGYFAPAAPPLDTNGARPEATTEQLPRVPQGGQQSGAFPPARAPFGRATPPAPPLRPEQHNGADQDQTAYTDQYTDLDLDEGGQQDGFADYPDADYPDVDDLDADEYVDDDELDEDRSPAKDWLVMAGQVAISVVGGAAVWLGFNWLWGKFPQAALIAALAVIVGLVWIVRKIRRADDLQTTGLAVLVGLFVTVSPAALLLLGR